MANLVSIFREIHRLKKHAHDLQSRIDQMPRLKKAQENLVTKREESLKAAQDHIKHLKVTIHEKEVSLRTSNQQLGKFTKQLDESAGKKEYDALRLEITHAKEQIQKFEDEILEAMSEVDDKTAALPAVENELKDAKQQRADFDKDAAIKMKELSGERDEELAKLKVEEEKLPEDARYQYDRLVKAHGPDALSQVEGRTCVSCYTEITQQHSNELRNGLFVACKNCGRILYLTE